MGVTAAVVATTAAAASAAVTINNSIEASGRADAAKALADQQQAELTREAADRAALAKRAAAEGSQFGFEPTETLHTGFGFGAPRADSANAGRGQITGGG